MIDIAFDNVIELAAKNINEIISERDWSQARFIRDMYGKLFVILPNAFTTDSELLAKLNEQLSEALGSYAGSSALVTTFEQTLAGDDLLHEPYILYQTGLGVQVCLIDRRAMGQHWVLEPKSRSNSKTPRFVFFSLKGGVGRSTALALWARELCQQNKTVLVVDLDLEAPGLGAQMLERTGKPLYGVGDWLVEDLVDNNPSGLIPDMAAQSPLSDSGLWVVPAFGTLADQKTNGVVSKLARAYLDKPTEDGIELFTKRLQRLVAELEQHFEPDIVLIDSRAGLHETVASALLHLNAEVLCFGVDLEVTWQGYRYLFSHLAQLVQQTNTQEEWRDRFKMVAARFHGTNISSFTENSYSLWVDTLYDEASAELGEEFSFDLNDSFAPHYPYIIPRSESFEAFQPCMHINNFQEVQIQETFGNFFKEMEARLVNRLNRDE